MKVGDKVITKFGCGTVVKIEEYNRLCGGTKRFCVDLDVNPFFYSPVCFWPDECRKA